MILNAIGSTAASSTTAKSQSLDASSDPSAMQDRFLKLLVAQLNNQDPMNPMDNAEMTTQMAQINTVTGIQSLNLSMQGMAEEFSTMQQIQGTSLIGRSVLTEGNRMGFQENIGTGYFNLDSAAANVTVEVITPGGVLVDSIDMGSQEKGRRHFEWDSSQYTGSASDLRFRVTATNGNSAVATSTLSQSQVVATGSSAGALTLTLENGETVNYFRIHSVL